MEENEREYRRQIDSLTQSNNSLSQQVDAMNATITNMTG
jgi:hypothetical protein